MIAIAHRALMKTDDSINIMAHQTLTRNLNPRSKSWNGQSILCHKPLQNSCINKRYDSALLLRSATLSSFAVVSQLVTSTLMRRDMLHAWWKTTHWLLVRKLVECMIKQSCLLVFTTWLNGFAALFCLQRYVLGSTWCLCGMQLQLLAFMVSGFLCTSIMCTLFQTKEQHVLRHSLQDTCGYWLR